MARLTFAFAHQTAHIVTKLTTVAVDGIVKFVAITASGQNHRSHSIKIKWKKEFSHRYDQLYDSEIICQCMQIVLH